MHLSILFFLPGDCDSTRGLETAFQQSVAELLSLLYL